MIAKGILFVATCLVMLPACKKKKQLSLAVDEVEEAADFIGLVQPLPLPYKAGDTIFLSKDYDSLRISESNFSRFVPDSISEQFISKDKKAKIYAIGTIAVKGGETYLLTKTVAAAKKTLLLLAFDKKKQFVSAMTLLTSEQKKNISHSVSIDAKHVITRFATRKNADGSASEGKEVYAFNAQTGSFLLILTEALDDKVTELINPIDTLSQKFKYTADYGTGTMNLVSVRDGKREGELLVFIHIEKGNGKCTGELKGKAVMRKPNMAEYRESGDPCVLQLIFSSSFVTLKEVEGCGSRRGLTCSFDGSFPRKKNTVSARPKK